MSRACLALTALAAPLAAQRVTVTACEESKDSPKGPDPRLCGAQPRPGFKLFALEDNAVVGLRTSVPDAVFKVASSSIGDRTALGNDFPLWLKGMPKIGNRASVRFFEFHLYVTAARGDWLKAQETIPSLKNVKGGGWTFLTNSTQYGGADFWSGRDGSFGFLFEGVPGKTGGCTDQTPFFLANGLPLLAVSDCPPTWPGGVWKGTPYFGRQLFEEYQAAVGKSNFTFDFWKAPSTLPSLTDPNRRFLGITAQTYAVSSDHGRQTRESFGTVVPLERGGTRKDPTYEGYPAGIDVAWDAYTFDVTAVGRMEILQARIINNSKDVYGTGIDYDSLFIGFQWRWLQGDGGANGRRANVHSIPELGAVVANELGRAANCDNFIDPGYILGSSCATLRARNTSGFNVGATGVLYLKSPIGDLRNKLFTRDSRDPFYNPTHPNRGDTLTFNRMALCGFDCANVQIVSNSVQRGFGTIAARENLALAGRGGPQALTPYDYWNLFKPAAGLDARFNPASPRAGGGFNFCLPGGWRYTNRPKGATAAGPDTLFLDDCNPTTNTRTALWSDTLPDRSINWAFNNTWAGAGPFPLKSGDTTGMVIAIITAPDSLQFMNLLQNAYNFYVNGETTVGAGLPQPVRIALVTADTGIAGLGQNRVTLFLDYTTLLSADPAISSLVQRIRTEPADRELGRLFRLNPWLADSITRKAAGLVDTLYVFKSCNGGTTFTATKTRGVCPTDRAVDPTGVPIGTGWQAYDVLTRDATTGVFAPTYTDEFVTGGQRYLYSLVAHRPALTFTVVDSGVVNGQRTLVNRTYTAIEAALSPLSTNRNAPNVAEVYVPVSSQSGSKGPQIATSVIGPTPIVSTVAGDVVPFHPVAVRPAAPFDTTLRYSLYFGDTLKVEVRDALTAGRPDTTFLYLIRTARTGFTVNATSGANTITRTLRDTLTFVSTQVLSVPTTGVGAAQLPAPITVDSVFGRDTVRITRRTIAATSVVMADPTVRRKAFRPAPDTTTTPYRVAYYASATPPSASTQTPVMVTAPGIPPVLFAVTNRSVPTRADIFWSQPGFARLRTTANPTISLTAQTTTNVGFGEYAFQWRDSEFGNGQPFTISLTSPQAAEQAVNQSLQKRERADSTDTSDSTVNVINRSVGNVLLGRALTSADLAKLYLPFTVTNLTNDSLHRRLTLAALKSQVPARIVLGSGADTISVAVDQTVWVPGTPLIFIEDVPVARRNTNGTLVRDASGNLTYDYQARVTFRSAIVGCGGTPRASCNPVAGLGATGHVKVRPQQTLDVLFYNPLTAESEFAFTVQPAQSGGRLQAVSAGSLDAVRVVPNPYVVQSTFEQGQGLQQGGRRLLFTHVPPQGMIRIFTAAGAFVQQLTWTPDMLNETGDLFWDMRTREGFDIGPGLYLFTVQATGTGGGAKRKAPGRFIIIR